MTNKDRIKQAIQESREEEKTWIEETIEGLRDDPDFIVEQLSLDLNEQIIERLQAHDLSRAEFARRLGVSKAYVTKLLNGNVNLTLKSLVSIAFALEARPEVLLAPRSPHALTAARHESSKGEQ